MSYDELDSHDSSLTTENGGSEADTDGSVLREASFNHEAHRTQNSFKPGRPGLL